MSTGRRTPSRERPPAHPANYGGLAVPQGTVAWMDKEGRYELHHALNGQVTQYPDVSQVAPAHMYTTNLASCIDVNIFTREGAIKLHISAYLIYVLHPELRQGYRVPREHAAELAAMQTAFRAVWAERAFPRQGVRGLGLGYHMAVVYGGYTTEAHVHALMASIVNGPNGASIRRYTVHHCDPQPNPREARHGTTRLVIGQTYPLWIEEEPTRETSKTPSPPPSRRSNDGR